MKNAFLIASTIVSISVHAQSSNLHRKSIVIDTHNDFPSAAIEKNVSLSMDLRGKTHTDLNRLQEGGVDVQIFSIWCDGDKQNPFAWANRQIDSVHAWVKASPDKLLLAYKSNDIHKAVKEKKVAAMIGVEGGHMMENDLGKLETLYNRGARYMTLTWNNSTPWASSAADESNPAYTGHKGLTDFGRELIKKMNSLGMLVDLSHTGEQTVKDVLAVTTKPILVSHSCVHAICPVPRNLKDDQIIAIAKNGGVIHLNFYAGFVDSNYISSSTKFMTVHKAEFEAMQKANPAADKYYLQMQLVKKHSEEVNAIRPTLNQLLNHLDYIVKLVGVDHVGLGSDFDGIEMAPQGLDGVQNFPAITAALVQRGYNKKDIRKILGGNFLRLLKANEQ